MSLQYGNIGFTQFTFTQDAFPQAGQYLQQGILVFNSGFGQSFFNTNGYDTVASGVVDWGMWCAPINLSGSWNLRTVFSHLSYNNVQSLALAVTPDRRLELYVGRPGGQFSGTIIYTSPPNFFLDSGPSSTPTWVHLDLKVDAPNNRVRIYRNRVLFATVNAQCWANTPLYNSMTVHELENFGSAGVAVAHFYAASDFNVDYGRVSVALIAPWETADVQVTGWTPTFQWPFLATQEPPRVGGVLRARNVAPWGPSYPNITDNHALISGQGLALFGIDKCTPVGPIHALSIRVTAKATTATPTRIRGVVSDPARSATFFSPWKTMTGDYFNYDLVFPKNPYTSVDWLESQFVSVGFPYVFGFETDGPTDASGLYIVRLHTARETGGVSYFSSRTKVGG
jgi:hypothetical protein